MRIKILEELSKALKKNDGMVLLPLRRGESFNLKYRGAVIGKERPRFSSKSGSAYTPKKTREYEKEIRRLAKLKVAETGSGIFRCHLAAHCIFYDRVPDNWPNWMARIALNGVVFPEDGADLDNREKAILDPLNGVVYIDDKQIVQSYKVRRYAQYEGFDLTLEGVGLTKNDLDNLRKLMAL